MEEREARTFALSATSTVALRGSAPSRSLRILIIRVGHTYLAKGEYVEALHWYQQMSDYASAAGDKFWMARAPNIIGGVYLELYDLEEAIALNLQGDEISQKLIPWPEPRGHSLLKVGLAHLAREDHGLAEEFFRRAWDLLEEDVWYRWRWHIPLLRARGKLALAERRYDDAWLYAAQSLEMAKQSDSRKHVARAQRLQGDILAARGQLEAAASALRDRCNWPRRSTRHAKSGLARQLLPTC